MTTSEHPLQFSVLLSGLVKDECRWFGEGNTLISGGGIQRGMKVKPSRSPIETKVVSHALGRVKIPKELLSSFIQDRAYRNFRS
ncbi:MAG: hypothetical protein HC847_26805 [Hydrococcus sp. RU_2_2]|nr:hypothetical protein [Hydrococcus sp. RU_2_2]NJP20295.1 hypothetical protein [Hydrococcus sp. CRU_1_1]NJQ98025.1 hypothetical protein [Hydrococcus sp. CSU_1_8]